LVKTIHLPDIEAATYFSDLQFSHHANSGIWVERSSKQAGQRLEIHLESGVVAGESGEGFRSIAG